MSVPWYLSYLAMTYAELGSSTKLGAALAKR